MELEQIFKQVEWLDDERRKDKTTIGSLEERLIALEAILSLFLTRSKTWVEKLHA